MHPTDPCANPLLVALNHAATPVCPFQCGSKLPCVKTVYCTCATVSFTITRDTQVRQPYGDCRTPPYPLFPGAQAVCATCAGAGGPELRPHTFRCVVLDEGSQCSEPEALVALAKGAEQVGWRRTGRWWTCLAWQESTWCGVEGRGMLLDPPPSPGCPPRPPRPCWWATRCSCPRWCRAVPRRRRAWRCPSSSAC